MKRLGLRAASALLVFFASVGLSGSAAADPEPPITEEPPPTLPTDAGPITTPTFTLSAERPIAPGRAVLQFSGHHATVSAGTRYLMASVPLTSVAYTQVFTAINAKTVFVACRVLNEDTREATVATETGEVRIPARTARWVKGTIILVSHKTTPTTARVSVDRCEVTGLGAGAAPPAPPQVPPEVAHARRGVGRLGKALRAVSVAPAPAPLPSGPVASGITLSAQQPTQAGATLTVASVVSQGDLQLFVAPDQNAYFVEARFAERVVSTIIVRVTVPSAANKTHSVACDVANLGAAPASLSGITIAPGTSQWLDMKGDGATFTLENTSFAGSIALRECRVQTQSSAATSPGAIGPGGVNPQRPPFTRP